MKLVCMLQQMKPDQLRGNGSAFRAPSPSCTFTFSPRHDRGDTDGVGYAALPVNYAAFPITLFSKVFQLGLDGLHTNESR